MRILVIDIFGESPLDWILRCQADSHEVRWAISERKTPVGKGLVTVVPNWRDHVDWADLIFATDNIRHLHALDAARKQYPRKAIIAPSVEAARWETDRLLGMKVLKQHGIATPPCKEFRSYQDAIRYVKKEDRPFACKPCGEETDKSLSHVASTPEGLVAKLEGWEKIGKLKGSFILQEKVDGVCEMGVGGWFGPGGFNEAIEEDWEYKKLMPGNLGPNTGEMGTVQRFVRRSKLFNMVVKPLEPALEKLGYVGCVNVNCLIDAEGTPWPLEFTMRPGWPAFSIQQALNKGDHAEWLIDLAAGRDAKNLELDRIAVGVVMAMPPFPNSGEKKDDVMGIPIYGIKDSIRDDLHPCQVMLGDAPQKVGGKIVTMPIWATAGSYILIATSTGETVSGAREKVYRVLDNLKRMPGDPYWRTDIGRDLSKGLPAIQAHGFASGMEF